MKNKLLILFTFTLYISFQQIYAQEITGRVVAISDGDTFTLLTANKEQRKIRLAEIDTPEKGQPYGQKAQAVLSQLIFNKQVRVVQTDIDRYGRVIARVYLDNLDVNVEMIKSGAAWVYRQYAEDQKLYEYEEEARQAKRGLWSLSKAEQVPPWEWRRQGVKASEPVKTDAPTAKGYDCGSKRYCSEMKSCEEAKYYLEHCGLTRLDGDRDGVPCESLCK